MFRTRLSELLGALAGQSRPAALRSNSSERVAHVLRSGTVLALVAGVALLLSHFTNALLFAQQYSELDANREDNPLSWASSVAVAAVAVAALTAAAMTGPRLPLGLLGLITAFLSMDDMLGVHERIAAKLVVLLDIPPAWDSLLWPLLYTPLLIMTAILILRMTRTGTPETFRAGIIGLGMLGAAVVTEVVSAPWSTGDNIVHTIQGGVEEALELTGWLIIASAAVATLLSNVVRQATGDPHQIRSSPVVDGTVWPNSSHRQTP